jgi:ribonuclease-3
MAKDIETLKQKINYDFKDKALLREALTHRTYAVENSLDYDNQRLEFLGDAVLEIVLSEHLFKLYPEAKEGELTKMRSAMVNQNSLATLARNIKLGAFMITGKGEKENGGSERASTLSDLFEALIGAFYLDADLETVKGFVLELIKKEELRSIYANANNEFDAETLLKEWCITSKTTGVNELLKIAETIENHIEDILSFWRKKLVN